MRATAAICIAVSLWSASNVYLDGAGRDLLAKQHAAIIYAEAEKQIAELGSEVASLRSLAAAEAGKGGCRQNCRALREQASQAALELSKARLARTDMRPAEISGLAATVAIALSKKLEDIARAIAAVKALLFLALTELLVWLSIPAMVLLGQTPHPADTRKMIATPMSPVAKPARGTKAYYLARLNQDHPALAKLVHRGELSVHAASIKAGLRKAPAKAQVSGSGRKTLQIA